jgi:hypothetical protein
MAGQSVPLSRTLHHSSFAMVAAAKEINPQPAPTSVGHAQYNCTYYSTCLGIAAEKGWTGLSCEACAAYRPVPSEVIPYDACAQLLGAVLRTAQHDLEHGLDDSFWEAAAFVFHQPDFAVLCGLLDIDPDAALGLRCAYRDDIRCPPTPLLQTARAGSGAAGLLVDLMVC